MTEIIRPADRGDIPQLQRLFAEVFGHERHPSVWDWKYFDHPLGGRSMVVEADGRIVAHCGGTAVSFADRAERYQAMQSVDFMSSRRYAGGVGRGGVFARMVAAFFQEFCGPDAVRLLYGFPGERHRLVGERILGYRPVERVGEFDAAPSRDAPVVLEPLTLRTITRFRSPRFEVGAMRDPQYLEWRYLRHPLHHYSVVTTRRWPWRASTECIVRCTSEGRMLVMEWGGALDERAVQRMSDELRRMGRFLHGWSSGRHPISAALAGKGWTVKERDHYLEIRSFADREVPAQGEMYYSLGDYDVD